MPTKTPLVQYRWGPSRSPSCIVRISKDSRAILDRLSDRYRRAFLDGLIYKASLSEEYRFLVDQSSHTPA